MRVLDLFSGIGGFSLGLERAGMRTVAFCECEPYCRRVLEQHWPGVPIYDDVRTLTADALRRDGIAADVICGGFPCQDISSAGKGAGLAGERSGLWREYARLIGEVRPRYVIVENVAALLGRGLDAVLGDMAAVGYDAEWHCIPAAAVGAPHRRDRIWIVAYADAPGSLPATHAGIYRGKEGARARDAQSERRSDDVANADRLRPAQPPGSERERGMGAVFGGEDMADADSVKCEIRINDGGCQTKAFSASAWRKVVEQNWWSAEPDVGRVAHGVPGRVDRLKALGNAVVPQIPEMIGRAIMALEHKQ